MDKLQFARLVSWITIFSNQILDRHAIDDLSILTEPVNQAPGEPICPVDDCAMIAE